MNNSNQNAYTKPVNENPLQKGKSSKNFMTSCSPLDILITSARKNTVPVDQQQLNTFLSESECSLFGIREVDHNEAFTSTGKPLAGFRTPEASLIPDTIPGSRITAQAYESNYSAMLKNSPQLHHLFLTHRNYEVLNRKKYFNHCYKPQPTKHPQHLYVQQGAKYTPQPIPHNRMNLRQHFGSAQEMSGNVRTPQNEHLYKLSKVSKVERMKQIDSKLDYLHNLYSRQRNLYISTYKANNDLISEAFSTIKLLKDELMYVKTNCVCKYTVPESGKNETLKESGIIKNNDPNDNDKIDKLEKSKAEEMKEAVGADEGVNRNVNRERNDEDSVAERKDIEDSDYNGEEERNKEEKEEKEDNDEERKEKEKKGNRKRVKLIEEDMNDIEDRQQAEMIVDRFRKTKK